MIVWNIYKPLSKNTCIERFLHEFCGSFQVISSNKITSNTNGIDMNHFFVLKASIKTVNFFLIIEMKVMGVFR